MGKKVSRIQLNILPANSGDCLHLRFQSSYGWNNVIIDSGTSATADKLRALLKQIKDNGEKVDLLCFSHIDNDHIEGAEQVFVPPLFEPGLIRQIWMNVPSDAIPKSGAVGVFSPKNAGTAIKLLKAIVNYGIPFKYTVIEGDELVIGNARIQVVLPSSKRLTAFYESWKKDPSLYKDKSSRKDNSPTNGSSIALLCTIGERKLLLVGDAFAEDLVKVGEKYAGDGGFSIVKLPHHGSNANMTDEMLRSLKTKEFIISTVETPHRPGNQAMSILDAYGVDVGGVTLYGNYGWPRFNAELPGVKIIHPKKVAMTKDGIEVYSDGYSTQIFAESACDPDSSI